MKTSKARAKIKQQRIVKYFIDAAHDIIRQEGLDAVTIRKAADNAGYTSATLYNYFDNLQHLVFLATMTYLEKYNTALSGQLAKKTNSITRYMTVCKCFADYSFSEPVIYESLFFGHTHEKLEEYTQQYYDLFPEKIVKDWPSPLNRIYDMNSIHSRSFKMLGDCVKDGYLSQENAQDYNEINIRLCRTFLQDVRQGVLAKEEAVPMIMKFYYHTMDYYLNEEARVLLKEAYDELM